MGNQPPVGRAPRSRRGFLRAAGTAGIAGLAGCGTGGDGGTDGTPAETATETQATAAAGAGEGNPPGADMVGGPDDLQGRVDVAATVLDSDQGAGRFVFSPAVVWVETGGTVVWTFEGADHPVTVYHPQFDRPLRIPEAVDTPFNSEFSGVGAPGTSFNFVFDVPGVYNYFCKPHESAGMVGIVIVESPQGGPGTTAPEDVESGTAAEHLARQLELAGLGG